MTMTPYAEHYQKITDIDKYFETRGTEKIFIGEELKIYIPMRYEVYHMLDITETVKTLGVFDMIFDGKYRAGLLMLATIEIDPSEVDTITVGGVKYSVLTLRKGNRFICQTQVIKDQDIIYAVFMEFITRGKWSHIFGYEDVVKLFDHTQELCGSNLPVDHVILEVIYSHLARAKNDIATQFRHTDMSGEFMMIPLRSVSYATTSTAARLLGSYFNDALNSALLQQPEEGTNAPPFEALLM